MTILLSAAMFVGLAQNVVADNKPQLVRVPVQTAYIPQAFDNNDNAQFMVEGYLPSPCHKLGPFSTFVDPGTGTIQVEQWAYFHNVPCADMIVPFQQEVSVGILDKGKYKVRDSPSGQLLGAMPVQRALRPEPDEFFYASVRDAYVLPQTPSAPTVARIEGFLSNTCSRIKETRVLRESPNVVTILPIVTQIPRTVCAQAMVPFQREVRLPSMGQGRHLLHVRSLNGQAVNKLFDISAVVKR